MVGLGMKWACLKVGDVPTKGHHAEDNHDQAVHLGTLFPDPNGAEIYKTAVDPLPTTLETPSPPLYGRVYSWQ